MVRVVVDGGEHDVKGGRSMLEVCLSLGIDLPYFCWHPALGSVGACRQCAVKQYEDEEDEDGEIVMACMTPAEDGTRISVDDPEARELRACVIEWMMRNHPHDCPVCDEGGECHLQDMTVMTGHAYRRYPFPKRTFQNQDLGPLVAHEMNRCITCYRCVRFYRDHAGGKDLDAFGVHDRMYFGRRRDGTLESEFAGNLVEVCPTGVFTDRPLGQHYVRKWDIESSPSVCTHCGVGCNTLVGAHGGRLRRIRNRFHHEVNGYFLCDRGRYGYTSADIGADGRLQTALRRTRDSVEPVPVDDAVAELRAALGAGPVLGIGSPHGDVESNWALRRAVGADAFFAGTSDREWRLAREVLASIEAHPNRVASVLDAERSDGVLILGEPVSDTAPRLALALRQASRQKPLRRMDDLELPRWRDRLAREITQDETGTFFVVTSAGTRLDELGEALRRDPAAIATLGYTVAAVLGGDVEDSRITDDPDERAVAERIADGLRGSERPVIVTGTGAGSLEVLRAAAAVADACDGASIAYVAPESDSLGLALLAEHGGLEAACRAAEARPPAAVLLLETDLERRMPPDRATALLGAAGRVVALDWRAHETTARADLVLPVAAFSERTGTLVNHEGRAQRSFRAVPPHEPIEPAWVWLSRAGADVPESFPALLEAIAADAPELSPLVGLAPVGEALPDGFRVPRAPWRFSGRTAMHADESVHEPRPPRDPDAPLAFSMEGRTDRVPASAITFYHAPGWNSVQALSHYQTEVGEPLKGGSPGRRLFPADGRNASRVAVPAGDESAAVPAVPEGDLLAVAIHHVFGSEETSAVSPPVAGLVPAPYVAMRGTDVPDLRDGDEVEIEIAGTVLRLPVRIRSDLAPRTLGLPVGLPGMPFVDLPAVARRRG